MFPGIYYQSREYPRVRLNIWIVSCSFDILQYPWHRKWFWATMEDGCIRFFQFKSISVCCWFAWSGWCRESIAGVCKDEGVQDISWQLHLLCPSGCLWQCDSRPGWRQWVVTERSCQANCCHWERHGFLQCATYPGFCICSCQFLLSHCPLLFQEVTSWKLWWLLPSLGFVVFTFCSLESWDQITEYPRR